MSFNSPGEDYALDAARRAQEANTALELRVRRIEDALGIIPHELPKVDPIEAAKQRDADQSGRTYNPPRGLNI